MYSVLYNENGLVGVTNAEVQALPGISYISIDASIPDLNTHSWDLDQLQFIRNTSLLTKREFLERFTLQERATIRASQDVVVNDLMFLLDAATYVDLTDTTLQQGIGYLSSIGLVSAQRVQSILGVN